MLYHGTLLERLCKIAAAGLVPQRINSYDPTAYLWLSDSYQGAGWWAERRAGHWVDRQHETRPYTVLRVRGRPPLEPDPNLPDAHSFVTRERIAPEWIDALVHVERGAETVRSTGRRWQPLLKAARRFC